MCVWGEHRGAWRGLVKVFPRWSPSRLSLRDHPLPPHTRTLEPPLRHTGAPTYIGELPGDVDDPLAGVDERELHLGRRVARVEVQDLLDALTQVGGLVIDAEEAGEDEEVAEVALVRPAHGQIVPLGCISKWVFNPFQCT